MTELFGIPMGDILIAMVIAFAIVLGIVAVFAVRSRVFLRLALRSASRRLGRTALIVAGLMLGTTIITAAFSTGDTMSYTIRSEVLEALGNIDEVVSREGAEIGATIFVDNVGDIEYFDEQLFATVQEAANESDDIDGITPAIIETVGVQDLTSAQTEPRVTIFAPDPGLMEGFGQMRDVDSGAIVELAGLAPGEVYLNADAAEELHAAVGDELVIYALGGATPATVSAVVEYDGTGTTESAILMPLASAQEALGADGLIKHVLVSNRGGNLSGIDLTDSVITDLEPALRPLNLEADPTKKDSVELADETGAAFLSIFITFGSFSVIAGMLLIFLIFVMLAQERKGEMGVTRAVGAQRSHLAQAFAFEGVAYDLLAALVGGAAGVAISFGMVVIMSQALGDIAEIRHTVVPRSIIIAYIIGMLVTFIVVTFSAWRVSALNIVRAIRDLPDPVRCRGGGRGWLFGIVAVVLGALLAYSGVDGKQAAPLSLGVSMVLIGSVPILRRVGVPDRPAYTIPGVTLVIYWLLPFDAFVSDLSMDFTIFILSGIFVVTGATWVVMYNSDILIARSARLLAEFRGLAPALKTAVAYPLTSKFRTGVTLAMFTLVVFTMVVMSITITSFGDAFDNEESFGGGYDVRATAVSSNPITDPEAAIADAPGLAAGDFESVALQSGISVQARQAGSEETKDFEDYAVLGFDDSFLTDNTYGLATRARGYDSDRAVWDAIRDEPGLAIVSQDAVPRRQNWGFSAGLPDFRLEGLYIEDSDFEPVTVRVVDQQTNTRFDVTIIGVLSDAGPFFLTGITTSQRKLEASIVSERITPTTLWVNLRPGVDAEDTAEAMESAFLANGLEANSLASELADAVELNQTFNYIIQGFMSLGLIVGVVAIGVISARSVVERRQQIGVLRSIGFQKSTVQLSFLLESSLVALIGIFVGTVLGLIVAYDVIDQAAATGSWANLSYKVPFRDLAIIFTLVYLAALLASWFPARQAARVYPAEALRYE